MADDGAALDLGGEARRQRHPQVLAALGQAGDAMADHARDQAAADGFDFGQLGHGLESSARAPNSALPTRTWVAPSRTAVS